MLSDIQSMLVESILSISVVSKKYRLKCLSYLSRSLDPGNEAHIQFILQVLPEVVLCVKDSSKKVRAICLAIVTRFSDVMAHSTVSYQRNDGSTHQASLREYLGLLTACLTAQSTHMQAAAVLSLAVVLRYHWKTNPCEDILLDVLHCVYELMKMGNRELVKAGLRYIRIACRLLNEDDLMTEIDAIMEHVMATGSENKNKFRTTIRSILEVLLRRVGEEEVRSLMPEEDLALLTNILRMERRKENTKKHDVRD